MEEDNKNKQHQFNLDETLTSISGKLNSPFGSGGGYSENNSEGGSVVFHDDGSATITTVGNRSAISDDITDRLVNDGLNRIAGRIAAHTAGSVVRNRYEANTTTRQQLIEQEYADAIIRGDNAHYNSPSAIRHRQELAIAQAGYARADSFQADWDRRYRAMGLDPNAEQGGFGDFVLGALARTFDTVVLHGLQFVGNSLLYTGSLGNWDQFNPFGNSYQPVTYNPTTLTGVMGGDFADVGITLYAVATAPQALVSLAGGVRALSSNTVLGLQGLRANIINGLNAPRRLSENRLQEF